MPKDIKINASILCADFTKLGDEIKRCEDAGVDMLHVDVMDGHFVPNITVGQIIVQTVRSATRLPVEAHLMVEHPGMYIDSFADAGADIISIQAECYGRRKAECRGLEQFPKEVNSIDAARAREDIRRIKKKGKKAFMVLNPGTPLCLDAVLDDLDGVMIMSVNPGFARQKFMPLAIPKIENLRGKFDGDIEVDGGINEVTAPEAVKAGANILATASYFFGASRPREVVQYLKALGDRR
ncbi:MAG: ribulose-phosphate 3-epimerase [Candidatus Omnitrophica bacterium]|nr:ribulose-phosphate 3-epimerase [Candidatus Omnitrophota bacterium]